METMMEMRLIIVGRCRIVIMNCHNAHALEMEGFCEH